MNEQNHDPFDLLFQRAQVELPDHLKRRLLSIPGEARTISLWDIRSLLPVLAFAPGIIWLLLAKSFSFWTWLGVKISSLADAIPATGSASIPVNAWYIGTATLVFVILAATWLFLRAEQRNQFSYVRQLTSAG